MGKPDYDRARNALEFNVQKMGITMYVAAQVTRGRWASGDYSFAVDLRINDVPLWSGVYTMGSGHAVKGQQPIPEVADILHSIFLDASCFEAAGDLHEFCEEFGYANDVHSARNKDRGFVAYRACRKAARDLHDAFSDQEYATLQQLSSML